MSVLLMLLLLVLSIFLIILVLIQRGKGGGLAGALGGMGGQSAFGTKAGDLFTKITIGVAAVWILLCMVGVRSFAGGSKKIDVTGLGGAAPLPQPGVQAPANPGPANEKPAEAPAK